jgi:phosphoenolpyruvate carboxykinase (GTP)
MAEVSNVNIAEWRGELPLIERWFETIGKKLPSQMEYQLRQLKAEIEQEELY